MLLKGSFLHIKVKLRKISRRPCRLLAVALGVSNFPCLRITINGVELAFGAIRAAAYTFSKIIIIDTILTFRQLEAILEYALFCINDTTYDRLSCRIQTVLL